METKPSDENYCCRWQKSKDEDKHPSYPYYEEKRPDRLLIISLRSQKHREYLGVF